MKIHGTTKEVTLNIDGPSKKILVFQPTTITPLTLAELSVHDTPETRPSHRVELNSKHEAYDGGAIRISDKAANAMIYTGAAVLLGTQLGKILSKRD